ncbi:MAG: hypothetical protein WBA89_25280 [Microcoleus sp.]|uniref:hypothetical protein n=1 Tax=Microcoleus sp. TaxID=44472 RepID=UPI003C76488B
MQVKFVGRSPLDLPECDRRVLLLCRNFRYIFRGGISDGNNPSIGEIHFRYFG